MQNLKAFYFALVTFTVLSCGNTDIELKNNWHIHDNVECDYLLDYWNWDMKNGPSRIPLQEYCFKSDSVIIVKYDYNVPASTGYTILNLYTFERKEYIDKYLKNDTTVYSMFRDFEFIKP